MKHQTAGFVPYRIEDGEVLVFVQMRTKDAPHNPGKYAIFGGRLHDGETVHQALVREVYEELTLTIDPEVCSFLGLFEEEVSQVNLFYLQVGSDFEETIDVREGDYGTFLSKEEIEETDLMRPVHKKIFLTLIEKVGEAV